MHSYSPYQQTRFEWYIPRFSQTAAVLLCLTLLLGLQVFSPNLAPPQPPSAQLNASEMAGERAQSNKLNQILRLAFAAILLVVTLRQWRLALRLWMQNWPIFLIAFYALLSTNWALAPDISFRRAVFAVILVFSVVSATVLVSHPARVMRLLYWVFAFFVVASALTIPIPGSFHVGDAVSGSFKAFQDHKNVFGGIIGLALIIGIYAHRFFETTSMRFFNIFYMCLCVLMLYISKSKTPIGMVPVVVLMMMFVPHVSRLLRVSVGTVMVLTLGGITLLIWLIISGFGLPGNQLLGFFVEDVSFTERDQIWKFVWEQAEQRWLLGYGHQSFWSIGDLSVNLTSPSFFITKLNSGHNGYLDLWVTLGLVGVLLFIPYLWRFDSGMRVIRDTHPEVHNACWAILLYCLLINLTESTILAGGNPIWCAMIMVAALVERARFDTMIAQHQEDAYRITGGLAHAAAMSGRVN